MEPGAFYHLFNRGNNRQQVFREPADYHSFLLRWRKYIHPVAETWAYSLLPNHFHTVIRIREELKPPTVTRAFTNFFIAFARTLQSRHQLTGAVFHRHYRRIQIENEDTLRWTIGYVLTNITHHNPAQDYRLYSHSAYRAFLSEAPTLLAREKVCQLFEGKEGLLSVLRNQAAYYGLENAFEEI